jgi:hypothetical protein
MKGVDENRERSGEMASVPEGQMVEDGMCRSERKQPGMIIAIFLCCRLRLLKAIGRENDFES